MHKRGQNGQSFLRSTREAELEKQWVMKLQFFLAHFLYCTLRFHKRIQTEPVFSQVYLA